MQEFANANMRVRAALQIKTNRASGQLINGKQFRYNYNL